MWFYFLQLLLKGASERGAKRIRVHILTDGRDVLDGSSVGFVETLEKDLEDLQKKGIDARIASGGGRMYVTMDRYEVWICIPHFCLRCRNILNKQPLISLFCLTYHAARSFLISMFILSIIFPLNRNVLLTFYSR